MHVASTYSRRSSPLDTKQDDCWQVARNASGYIVPDPVRFPNGMKSLTDYVHSKGLKFGLYTARGSGTCQGRPGSLNHEYLDAASYCEWGIDYIKIDACKGAEDERTAWTRFHEGLTKCYADVCIRWLAWNRR